MAAPGGGSGRNPALAAAEARMAKAKSRGCGGRPGSAGAGHRHHQDDTGSIERQRTQEDEARDQERERIAAAAAAAWNGESASEEGLAGKNCLVTVKKLVDNILAAPEDPKKRSIKADNKVINEKILKVTGGGELLRACGWERSNDGTTWDCHPTTPVTVLCAASDALNERLFGKDILSSQ